MTDQGLDTIVAGVRCRDVLADLSEYVDGQLNAERVSALQGDLAACDRCANFGGHVMNLLQSLRAGLAEPPALDSGSAARLRDRLASITQPS